ncbi:cadherin-like protein 26 [Scophthalmus maximus]|uniref:cadherin-like protein 26 n=1 Tax=Scophthalmus maximus TaxID=52904 RepID=UPI001FA83519|nr:cadherin-like protein 26 [Scophthalmus maximus]
MRTRNISLLLLVALAALDRSHGGNHSSRAKRELLVRSKRKWVLATIELTEEEPGPYPRIITQMTNDKREDDHEFRIRGMGVDEEPLGVFSIDKNTGFVSVHRSVDREEHDLYHIRFEVLDRITHERIDRELAFDVEIQDINDNAPIFSPRHIEADVKENTPAGDLEVGFKVTDADLENSPNSKFDISLTSQKPKVPKFGLKHTNGQSVRLTFEGCFDYDKMKKYEVILTAKDHGTPPLSSTAVVTLNIVDSNTHPPTFKKNQYRADVLESTIKRDVLRLSVEDKDTPNTPGWRARYFFITGNEEENYQLETDPETNEGILSVVKAKDYEKTTLAHLQIGVENEEPLFVCKGKSSGAVTPPPTQTVSVAITVIDVNDPPQFDKDLVKLYVKEEEEPEKLLFTPKARDPESDNFRYVLIEDPAHWMTVDEETGQIKSTQKMDRESPFVDKDSVYKVTIGAVDDGKPPATGTCTVLIHMADINDNTPKVVNKSAVMCGNKVNKVTVPVKDTDHHPYGGPFTFSLGGDDDAKSLKQRWKLDPASGEEVGLVSLKPLPYGNYFVPLVIHDQQGMSGPDTLEVIVCDCGEADVCPGKVPISIGFSAAAIGLVFAGLLLFLLLLLIITCQCGRKAFSHIPIEPDGGNQTLIKYNQEAGGAACEALPMHLLNSKNGAAQTDGLKKDTRKIYHPDSAVDNSVKRYNPSGLGMGWSTLPGQGRRDTVGSFGGQDVYSTWMTKGSNSNREGYLRHQQSLSVLSSQQITNHIQRKLQTIEGNHNEPIKDTMDRPREFADEGRSIGCQSLDQLSLINLGDDLEFLNDLGPTFNKLGNICHQAIQDGNVQM